MRIVKFLPNLKDTRHHLMANHHPIKPPNRVKSKTNIIVKDLRTVLGKSSQFIITMNRNRKLNLVGSFRITNFEMFNDNIFQTQ